MKLNKLVLQHFRNIAHASLSFGPAINLFTGPNGAGKSSLLEAVHLLSYGRSFRSKQQERMIQHEHNALTLFAEAQNDQKIIQMGYERPTSGKSKIKVDSCNKPSLSAISKHLPAQLLTTTSYRYFTDGPKIRRSHLNWGVYYSEPTFNHHWQRYQKAIKQRNAAIKARLPLPQLSAWDNELHVAAEAIHQQRRQYIADLQPVLQQLLDILLKDYTLILNYECGWDDEQSFIDALANSLPADMQTGFTLVGPHRADCQIMLGEHAAHLELSQGQQKLAVYALCFAQGLLLTQHTGNTPIYLIDDLVSELDSNKIGCLAQVLQHINAQTLITGIHAHLFEPITDQLPTQHFNVSAGTVSPATANIS